MITEQALRELWKEAFGDTDAFLDGFFREGFSPERCGTVFSDGKLAAALYWFDCTWQDQKLAYIYAVATAKEFRGQGFCRKLMEDTHTKLRQQGYSGAVLVPVNPGVAYLYAKLGYRNFGGMRRINVQAGNISIPLTLIGPEEYARRKQHYLPADGIRQEGRTLSFLGTYARFYRGENALFAVSVEDEGAYFQEFFGDLTQVPAIIRTLGVDSGRLRIPDRETPFAMFLSFAGNTSTPGYLGIALD